MQIDLNSDDLAEVLARLDICRRGWSYQETAQQIVYELEASRG